MLTWKMHEDYLKQETRFDQMKSKYVTREQEAGQRVNDLKAAIEATIQQEFKTGNDLTKDRDKLRKELQQAEADYISAQEERTRAYHFASQQSGDISERDLVFDMLENYIPEARKAEVEPIVETIKTARSLYFNALLDLFEVEVDYKEILKQAKEISEKARNKGQTPEGTFGIPDVVEWYKIPLIKDVELNTLENYRHLPNGVERKPIGGTK